jgi:hypothetical protein
LKWSEVRKEIAYDFTNIRGFCGPNLDPFLIFERLLFRHFRALSKSGTLSALLHRVTLGGWEIGRGTAISRHDLALDYVPEAMASTDEQFRWLRPLLQNH